MHDFWCGYCSDFRDSSLIKPLDITHGEVSWTTATAFITIHSALDDWVAAATSKWSDVAKVVRCDDNVLLVGLVVEVVDVIH